MNGEKKWIEISFIYIYIYIKIYIYIYCRKEPTYVTNLMSVYIALDRVGEIKSRSYIL